MVTIAPWLTLNARFTVRRFSSNPGSESFNRYSLERESRGFVYPRPNEAILVSMESKIRSLMPACLGSMPAFRGKGRITLLLDRVLTDIRDPRSYEVIGDLNDGVPFNFDLRPWGQKFAYYYREWEREYINILRRMYNGGVFLDVGSSLGLY